MRPHPRANPLIAASGNDTSNFSGGPYTPSTSASDSRTRHNRCCAATSTPTAGSPHSRRAVEQIGEPVGLIVIGGQLHQQQPVRPRPVRRRRGARRSARRRGRRSVPARRSRPRPGTSRPASISASRSAKPQTAVTRCDGRGVQPQIQRGDDTEGAFGADEQRRQVVSGVVAAHQAVPAQQRPVGQRHLQADRPARPCCRSGPCAGHRRWSRPCRRPSPCRGRPGPRRTPGPPRSRRVAPRPAWLQHRPRYGARRCRHRRAHKAVRWTAARRRARERCRPPARCGRPAR